MKTYLFFAISFLISTPSFANICERTETVRIALEELTAKPCDQISEADLLTVTSLDLNADDITELDKNDFRGLKNLKGLGLGYNSINQLPETIFDDLSSLESLFLADNPLKTLPTGIFDRLTNLEHLNLERTHIAELPIELFKELRGLKSLNIATFDLKSVPTGLTEHLTKLEKLEVLSLSPVPAGFFAKGSQLKELRFISPLHDTDEFQGLPNLETLSIEGIYGVSIPVIEPATFRNLPKLKNLRLQYTTVTPGTFRETKVEKLDLAGCRFPQLSQEVWSGLENSLVELQFFAASFYDVAPSPFANLKQMKVLEFTGFHLQNGFREDFLWGLQQLESIDMNQFAATILPTQLFRDLTALKVLKMGDTAIGKFPRGLLKPLVNVESMRFMIMNLYYLESAEFAPLTKLESIDFAMNKLEEIPVDLFANLPNLKKIDLGANKIRNLQVGTFATLENQLEEIRLTQNPLGEDTINRMKASFGSRFKYSSDQR